MRKRSSRKPATTSRDDRRAALCLDASGTRRWLRPYKFYDLVRDPAAERDGLLRVKDEWGKERLFPAARFRLVEAPRRSRPDAARRVMADGLEAALRAQRRGRAAEVGDGFVPALVAVYETDPLWCETVSLAIGFWEEWAAAARNRWRRARSRADLDAAEWAREARAIARMLRREIAAAPERPAWFRGVFGPSGRLG